MVAERLRFNCNLFLRASCSAAYATQSLLHGWALLQKFIGQYDHVKQTFIRQSFMNRQNMKLGLLPL